MLIPFFLLTQKKYLKAAYQMVRTIKYFAELK